jgi:hypothetical protein
VSLIELPSARTSNKATAVDERVHDHVNVDVDVHVLVDVIRFCVTAPGVLGLPVLRTSNSGSDNPFGTFILVRGADN